MLKSNCCSKGKECRNISIIKQLQKEIHKLKKTIDELMKMNEYFKLVINNKEQRFKALTSNNSLDKDKTKQKRYYNTHNNDDNKIKYQPHRFAATTPVLPTYIHSSNSKNKNSRNNINDDMFISSTNYLRNSQQQLKLNLFRSKQNSNASSLNSSMFHNDKKVTSLRKKEIINNNNSNNNKNTLNSQTVPTTLFLSTTNSHKSSFNHYKYSASLPKKAIKNKNRRLTELNIKDSLTTLNMFTSDISSPTTSSLNYQTQKSINHHNTVVMKNPAKNYYDYLTKLSEKSSKHKTNNYESVSFLSLTPSQLKEIKQNPNLDYLINLTTFDEQFISEIRKGKDEYLYSLCDFLHISFIDFRQIIHLISRIKVFLSISIDLVRSLLNNTSTNVLLTNICKVIECEKASLYLYDSLSDKLIVYSADGMKINTIKIEKNKGIIGYVFKTKKRLVIDDAYQDPRFDREIDSQLHYKIKNILCCPLIDSHGDIFGIIEALNKKQKRFDQDDEELMNMLSKLASIILKNTINIDDNSLQISRLMMIGLFLIDIMSITDIRKFSERTEELLIRIFLTSNIQILFVNKDNLLHNYVKNITYTNTSIGLIYLVMKKKAPHGCPKVNNCKYHNTTVDIDARENLITFPILYEEICIGVIQCTVNCDLGESSHLPGEYEMECLKLISKGFVGWYLKHVRNM